MNAVVSGPAPCQCCGKVADFLYPDPQPVRGPIARNLCAECIEKRRRGEQLRCESDEET